MLVTLLKKTTVHKNLQRKQIINKEVLKRFTKMKFPASWERSAKKIGIPTNLVLFKTSTILKQFSKHVGKTGNWLVLFQVALANVDSFHCFTVTEVDFVLCGGRSCYGEVTKAADEPFGVSAWCQVYHVWSSTFNWV